MRKSLLTLTTMAVILVSLTAGLASAGDEKFPHRADFSGVKTVDTDALYDGLTSGEFIVVDVRSQLEFDVIHVDGAQHVPVSKQTFAAKLGEVVKANPDKKVAFYCNGITCLKSYKATQKAMAAGFDNTYAYDAGIPEWANLFPQKTLLLGRTITDPATQLIAKSKFKDKFLAWSYFQAAAEGENIMVIDLRDSYRSR